MPRSHSKKKLKRNSSSRSSRRSNRRSRDRSRERRGYKSKRALFDATPRRSNSRSRSRGRSHARRSRSRSRSRRRTSSRRSQSRDSKLAEVLQQLLKEKKSPAVKTATKVPQQMLRGDVSADSRFKIQVRNARNTLYSRCGDVESASEPDSHRTAHTFVLNLL